MKTLVVVHDLSKALKIEGVQVDTSYFRMNLTDAIVNLSKKYSDFHVAWIHKDYYDQVNFEFLIHGEMFHPELWSFAPDKMDYIPSEIGLVDQSIFINVSKRVKYPTWIMSSIVGKMAPNGFRDIELESLNKMNFDFFLNLFAKQNMPLGLKCYSQPQLLKNNHYSEKPGKMKAVDLFNFVYLDYKPLWSYLMAFHFFISLKSEFFGFLGFLIVKRKKVDFRRFGWVTKTKNEIHNPKNESIDVLIPTLGRPEYLKKFLNDLRNQSLLPKRVIIIEQRPEGAKTELNYLKEKFWPFEIIHHCIHQFGACNARNIGLKEVQSKWLFLADDDISIEGDFIEQGLNKLKSQNSDVGVFQVIEKRGIEKNENWQWGAFGSGCSLVKTDAIKDTFFDIRFEFGFGEDSDFGMQLRNNGHDILYFSAPSIFHHKAPIGGFRQEIIKPWDTDKIIPRPSPTVMLFNLLHQTSWQRIGYRYIFFLKNLRKKSVLGVLTYLINFNARWQRSVYWGQKLEESA